jgi:hypothetical protein
MSTRVHTEVAFEISPTEDDVAEISLSRVLDASSLGQAVYSMHTKTRQRANLPFLSADGGILGEDRRGPLQMMGLG